MTIKKISLSDNKLVRGNYHILKHQKKSIKAIAKKKDISESGIVRTALDNFITDNQ